MFYYAHAEVVVIAYVTYKTQIHIHVCAEVRVLDEQFKKKKNPPTRVRLFYLYIVNV